MEVKENAVGGSLPENRRDWQQVVGVAAELRTAI